ncbi:hypothetical protein PBI_JACE_42 [Gordonia phage Jace]|uniref:Uncharacterized protein n=1 Tax=Gordonia phage Jace TaxID=2182360 RepID=A0A2U8UJ24_9CAUD|nr:hypothetical protein HOT28_gp42 [Gordonia phage Jace]AWN03662.1 hypothetical protein PBI_JACE_42 [Gordonia phage Jace]
MTTTATCPKHIAPGSYQLRDAMRDVENGELAARDVLLAIETYLVDFEFTVPSAYGTSTLGQAFEVISGAASSAKLAGANAAADSREKFRRAFVAERARRAKAVAHLHD